MIIKNKKQNAKKHFYKQCKIVACIALLTTGLFYYSFYQAVKFVERRDNSIRNESLEIGMFLGLQEGYNNAKAEDWDMLSKNPEVVRLLKKYFPEYTTARIAYAVAQAESSGRQIIKNINRNGSWDCGYLQINTIHKNKTETMEQFCNRMSNLEENIKLASKIHKQAGNSFKDWVTYNTGKYLTYLK